MGGYHLWQKIKVKYVSFKKVSALKGIYINKKITRIIQRKEKIDDRTNHVSLGKDGCTKSDEISEKFQGGGHFQ